MMMLILSGTVGRDAELRRTGNGDAVLNFSLAIDNGKDKSGNKRDATWFDCSIWGQRATSLEAHITKGSKLTVTGRPSAREHNGKVYLGCSVNDLTFMGGGNRDAGKGYQGEQGGAHGEPSSFGAGGFGNPSDMDDEVPF